ncbi:DUF192 domain-containing protein [Paramylibacter kogurei]|uniref:DUF192 domain-containing protein n=1 Tax=Paramylibacter kogurei TaxID=1889778 RepID=UPI001F0A3AF3|nr:DUF192 domain-containing protein [Amylibacter kogurei]
MSKSALGILPPLASIFIALCLTSAAFAKTCTVDVVNLRWDGGAVRFQSEVVDTVEERAQGLMHRESMARYSGMLFVYDRPQPVAFWMENTLIPLDMLFFDSAGRLQHIHENAVPLDRTSIYGGESIQYVLEINGGMAAKLRIPEGAEIQHPSILNEFAAWPCKEMQ